MSSARIFINYRREDSAGWVLKLHDDLQERFGVGDAFRDVGMLKPGEDFVVAIERALATVKVCLVVIGPRWASMTDEEGVRRLDDSADLVRREIELALQRPDVTTIPVLVGGATMPRRRDLPEDLHPLARREASVLSYARWDTDFDELCQHLEEVLGKPAVEQAPEQPPEQPPEDDATTSALQPTPTPTPQPMNVLLAALATLATTALAGVIAAAMTDSLAGRGEPKWGRLAGYAIERGVMWAIIGGIVAAAVAFTFGRVRVPLGMVLVGAGAGLLGGAAGGAGYMAMKHFGAITEDDARWLLLFVAIGLPGLLLAGTLARLADARPAECRLAAVAGAALAAMFYSDDRVLRVMLGALLVVGAIVAVLTASPRRGPTRAPRGATN